MILEVWGQYGYIETTSNFKFSLISPAIIPAWMFKLATIFCVIFYHCIVAGQNDVTYLALDSLHSDDLINRLPKNSPKFLTYVGDIQVKDICADGLFYPSDLNEVVANVKTAEDCTVMCRQGEHCQTFTYFKSLGKCMLSSASERSGAPVRFIPSAKYCLTFDITMQKAPKNQTVLPHGSAPEQCGLPEFPFHIETMQQKRRKRVKGGGEASFYSLPWMTIIVTNINHIRPEYALCGGSIIAETMSSGKSCHVLTARHCVVNIDWFGRLIPPSSIKVFAGKHDQRFREAHGQLSDVHMFTVHNREDIAIVFLDTCFYHTNYIRPICLPQNDAKRLNHHDQCFIAGWGCIDESFINDIWPFGGESSMTLKAARVNVSRESNMEYTTYANDVTTEDGGRAGKGDSGGPLFCLNPDSATYTIYGVVKSSNGLPRLICRPVPNSYMKVSYFRIWIDNVIKKCLSTTTTSRNAGACPGRTFVI